MTAADDDMNARFLHAANLWIRALLESKLEGVAGSAESGDVDTPPESEDMETALQASPGRSSRRLRKRPGDEPSNIAVASPGSPKPKWRVGSPSDAVREAVIDELKEALDIAANSDPRPNVVDLANVLGLSDFEFHLLLLGLAVELDPSIASLCARFDDRLATGGVSFGLGMLVLPDPAWEALSPQRPLRFWRLIEFDRPGSSLTNSPWRVDESILHHAKGLRHLDQRLADIADVELPATVGELPSSQAEVALSLVDALSAASEWGRLPLVQIVGPVDSGRRVAQAVATTLGLEPVRLPTVRMPSNQGELAAIARLWAREFRLGPVAVLLEGLDDLNPNDQRVTTGVIDRMWGLTFVLVSEPTGVLPTWALTVDVFRPTAEEQASVWQERAGLTVDDADVVSMQFDMEVEEIDRISTLVRPDVADQDRLNLVWSTARSAARGAIDNLAQRVDARATWADLVLPDREYELLQMLTDQASNRKLVYDTWGFGSRMNRGLGIAALFAGDSGTGKTMAAEVIANHLSLDLYRIDLATVVSKYIGETEKNLRRLFEATERSGAVLFFDEADALFGRRTDVKDSHDRYANIETDYLLQRLENYRGIAVLATNRRGSIDQAFVRRLRFIINFPQPRAPERERLWRHSLPNAVPSDDEDPVDFDRLSSFELAGGAIHGAALTGSFLAAADGGRVGMRHLVAGARNELLKLDRPG